MVQCFEFCTARGGHDCKITCVGEIERRLVKSKKVKKTPCGAIAQLGERIVRNDEVVGSSPTSSTIFSSTCGGRVSTSPGFVSCFVS